MLCRPVQRQFACIQLTDKAISREKPDGPRRGAELVIETMRSVRLSPDLGDRNTWFEAEETLPS